MKENLQNVYIPLYFCEPVEIRESSCHTYDYFMRLHGIYASQTRNVTQAAEAQGYAVGGFTPEGDENEPTGIVHKGEWVASQRLLRSPVARLMIEALDYAQRTNTIGSLRQADVSRSIAPAIYAHANTPPIIIQNATTPQEEISRGSVAMREYTAVIRQLKERLSEPFVTINTVTGDNGIKQAQDEYNKLMRNKTPKSRRK